MLVMIGTAFLFVLAACGDKVDDDTSDKFITKAEEVVSLLNEESYQEVHAMFDETMEEGLPVDDMREMFPPIFERSGDFEAFKKSSVEEKDDHYTVVLAANYSKENRVFTITLNEQEEVAGLFVK